MLQQNEVKKHMETKQAKKKKAEAMETNQKE
jgi:hypothetical protein